MIKIIFLMLICHFIGDYYLQSNKIAGKKAKSYHYTIIHCFYYLVPFVCVGIVLFKGNLIGLLYLFLVTLSHAFTDLCKLRILKKEPGKKLSYVLDQLCHYAFIVCITLLFKNQMNKISSLYLSSLSLDTLKALLLGVCLGQPHFITNCLLFYKDIKPSNFFGMKNLLLKLFEIIQALFIGFDQYIFFIVITVCFFFFAFAKKKETKDYLMTGLSNTITAILLFCLFKMV